MGREPLVSIIITTYRRPELLPRAINSVLNQTYKNIEVIVVDDNNPETTYRKDTENVMKAFSDDARVIYIKHTTNKRQSAALNTGIRQSRGAYIGFLDDDDEFMPDKIEKQVQSLSDCENDSSVGGAFCNVYVNHKNYLSRTTYTKEQCSRNLIYPMLMGQISYFGTSTLLKREVFSRLSGFNENLLRHVDWEFFTRFFNYYQLTLLPPPLAKINIEGARNNPNADKYLKAKEIFFKEIEPYLEIVDTKERKAIYRHNWFDVAISFFANGFLVKGCRVLRRALSYGVLDKKEWILLTKIIIKDYFIKHLLLWKA